ncbi:MAG TPA: hypothetical protein EYG86_07805 [Crocinitomicaceae bacterium]|nr:hypothetical protein [Crocinitomicaceae bacterium]
MKEEENRPTQNRIVCDSRICRVEEIQPGFLSFHFKGNHDSEIQEFKELITQTLKKIKYQPFVAINDLSDNHGSFSNEVKKYLVNHPDLKKYKLAEAVVVNSLGVRIQLNYLIKMTKHSGMLVRAFGDYDSALQWILKKKKELIKH